MPQGSLVERCRVDGAGIPGFYTLTGVGTMVELEGRPIKLDKIGAALIST